MLRRFWTKARSTELARYSTLLFAALTFANFSNYLFHVVISRMLGPAAYGALGALLSAFILISVPAGALQVVVAKRLSILRAREDEPEAGRFLRSMLGAGILVAMGSGIFIAAWGPWIAGFLHLGSISPALVLATYVVPAVVAPIARGALQGRLLFTPLAAISAGSTILRLASGAAFVALGWGVAGAIAASVVAEMASLAAALVPLRRLLAGAAPGRARLTGVLRDARMAVLAGGGFWAVVSLDIILVRHFFPGEVSGFYAAAAVAAHAVLFFPGAIAVVAFPRFAESEGRGVEARRMLFQAIVAVGALGLLAAGALSLLRSFVVRMLFGSDFLAGTAVIGVLGLAMALLGIVSILIYFHLASGSRALWSLVPAVVLEIAGILVFHDSIVQVSLVVLTVSTGLLVFNLIAAYALPGEPERVAYGGTELWQPASEEIDLTVVSPAFNPGARYLDNLRRLFEALRDSGVRHEVIAVSDGSTDGSHEGARDLAVEGFQFIHYEGNMGKGFALRTGLSRARGKYVAFIDSDGDLDPSEIHSFVTLMKTYDVDLVVGSKRHPLSEVHYPPLRRIMSVTYHLVVRVLFGIKLRDTQTGLKLAKRELLAQVLPRMLEKRFAFDLELLVIAKRLGFNRFFEAPVKLDYQFASTVSWQTTLGAALDTLAIFYRRYILRYYDHVPTPSPPAPVTEPSVPVEVVEVR